MIGTRRPELNKASSDASAANIRHAQSSTSIGTGARPVQAQKPNNYSDELKAMREIDDDLDEEQDRVPFEPSDEVPDIHVKEF